MRPSWMGRTMVCAPEGEPAGAGGAPPEPKKPADPPPPGADGRAEKAVMDDLARLNATLKRVAKHIGLDEAAEELVTDKKRKKKGDEPETSGGREASIDDVLAGDFELGEGGGEDDDENEEEEEGDAE